MNSNLAMQAYKTTTCKLCYQLAQVARFNKWKEDGKEVDKQTIVRTVEKVKLLTDEFITLKNELGFNDGFAFCENNKFDGFEIRNGAFYGVRACVKPIIKPWIYQNEEEGFNNYLYELGIYLDWLAYPESLDDQPISPVYGVEKAFFEHTEQKAKEKIQGGIFSRLAKKFTFGTSALTFVIALFMSI